MEPQGTQNQPAQSRQTIPLRSSKSGGNLTKLLPIILVIIIVAGGVITGFVVSSKSKGAAQQASSSLQKQQNVAPAVQQSFNQTFKDEAEGVVQKNDEFDKYAQGTHKLIRPGGDSQTAYLTSSVLDLDQYVGKHVKVYGETFGSSQVGWLMDVGKVEVIQ